MGLDRMVRSPRLEKTFSPVAQEGCPVLVDGNLSYARKLFSG
jgi:hypothetical protein